VEYLGLPEHELDALYDVENILSINVRTARRVFDGMSRKKFLETKERNCKQLTGK
jgi:hypothetical protein